MDTHLYKGEMTIPGVQLNVNVSSVILDQKQSSRKSVGPPDMSSKIVSGQMTIPRNLDRTSGVVFAPKI